MADASASSAPRPAQYSTGLGLAVLFYGTITRKVKDPRFETNVSVLKGELEADVEFNVHCEPASNTAQRLADILHKVRRGHAALSHSLEERFS